jgi:4-oxalocrotonate tautomerase
MPLVNVKVIEGVFSADQKKALIKGLTDAVVALEGESLRQLVWVVIEEVKSGEWAIGGHPVTTADVQAIVAGTAKPG